MIIIVLIICLFIIMLLPKKRSNNKRLMEDGYAIIPNVLSPEECDEIHNVINVVKTIGTNYGNIHSKFNREDMMVPVPLVSKYIKKIYKKINIKIDNPTICECSCLRSHPGAYPQIWHTDTLYGNNDEILVSIGIALQDIDDLMGPLHVYKGSNQFYGLEYARTQSCGLPEHKRGLCPQIIETVCEEKNLPIIQCTAKKGDAVLWLSSVVHRGSANISAKVRPVFYFSVMSDTGKNAPKGSTYSLLGDKIKIHSL